MPHKELQAFRERFESISEAPERIRNKRLVTLMEDLEQTYNIPLLRDSLFEKAYPEVTNFYREVSKARNFEEVK